MSRLGTITRRSFIVGSAAVAGGVAFGTWEATKPLPNPLHPEAGATALNPWIIIDQQGVTVIAPRAEMGQGVQTTLAALACEELEYPLDQVRIAHGPPGQVYANEALMLPRGYADGVPGGLGAAIRRAVPRVLSMQVTGGSSTTVDAFEKMRHAGAAAREVLILAFSDRMGIGIDQLRAEAGHVVANSGETLSYVELAEDAAQIEPPGAPRLKLPRDWTLIGHSQPRHDQPPKATGTALYGIDTRLPGMRFAVVKMNPRLGGPMNGFDAAAAEKMDGVEQVVDLGTGFAVVASNTWLALQAAEAVVPDWGPAPYPASTAAIFASIEAAFDGKPSIVARDRGDVDTVTSGQRVEASYRAPFLAHATMEPMSAAALMTEDGLELWAGNQAPVAVRDAAARAVGLGKDKVTLHTPIMGGGFGRRAYPDFAVLAARVAQAVEGTPVLVSWSREEDMTHDHYRPGAVAKMSAELEGGRPLALAADIAAPSLMAGIGRETTGFDFALGRSTLTEGCADQPYAIDNFRARGFAAEVAVPVGCWRSAGASQNAFFMESFIDELAHAAGADPLAFRLALVRPEHEPSAQVLEKVAAISGWSGVKRPGTGRGVALTYSFGTPVAEVVEVEQVAGDIRLSGLWIAADPGLVIDPANVEAQLTGGALFGLSAAIHGEITFDDGRVNETNFPDYESLRLHNAPPIGVALVGGGDRPQGVGEPGTPPAAPALANALYDLTGKRARELPLRKAFSFTG